MRAADDATLTMARPVAAGAVGPGGEHGPQLGPDAEVGAVEVDGQGVAPDVGAGVDELGVDAGEPGDVGGQVEAAVLGDDAVDERVDRGLVGDVEGGGAVGRYEVGDDHGGAPRPQQLDGGGADAGGPAGHQRDLPVHVSVRLLAHGVYTSGSSVNSTTMRSTSMSVASSGRTFAAYAGVSRKARNPA